MIDRSRHRQRRAVKAAPEQQVGTSFVVVEKQHFHHIGLLAQTRCCVAPHYARSRAGRQRYRLRYVDVAWARLHLYVSGSPDQIKVRKL
jgi:hypothetical protein